MRHKSNNETLASIPHLSSREIDALKTKLPTDWVEKVQALVDYSAATVRNVLRAGKPHPEVMPAIIRVAEEYQDDLEAGVTAMKERITKLTSN